MDFNEKCTQSWCCSLVYTSVSFDSVKQSVKLFYASLCYADFISASTRTFLKYCFRSIKYQQLFWKYFDFCAVVISCRMSWWQCMRIRRNELQNQTCGKLPPRLYPDVDVDRKEPTLEPVLLNGRPPSCFGSIPLKLYLSLLTERIGDSWHKFVLQNNCQVLLPLMLWRKRYASSSSKFWSPVFLLPSLAWLFLSSRRLLLETTEESSLFQFHNAFVMCNTGNSACVRSFFKSTMSRNLGF